MSGRSVPERIVLVPGVLALLPEYAGTVDPVADLRAACLDAVAWLGGSGSAFAVHGSSQGLRIARHLAAMAGTLVDLDADPGAPLLVVGNGSATRTEKAPGHFQGQAEGFDAEVRALLSMPDPIGLAGIDQQLARDVWADVDSLVWLGGEALDERHGARVDYDEAPYGVQYWVVRWRCES